MVTKQLLLMAAASAAIAAPGAAQAESGEGLSFEVSVGAAEIDTMSVDYGRLLPGGAGPGIPFVAESGGEGGGRFDARIGGFALGWFDSEAYLRAAHQRVDSSFAASYPKDISDFAVVPTGQPDTFTTSSLWFLAPTGTGTIAASRTLDQLESELAAGLVFDAAIAGFTPHVEIGYRRGDIKQRLTADRVGVTPILEEFTTNTQELVSDCGELVFGVARSVELSQAWTLRFNAGVGLGYCAHDLEGSFEVVAFSTPTTWFYDDDSGAFTGRGSLSAGVEWRLTPMLALGVSAFARGETDAPYVAFPDYTYGSLGELTGVVGDIRVETEVRGSYGAALTLRLARD